MQNRLRIWVCTFTKRFKNSGIEALSEKNVNAPVIEVRLMQFYLDLKDRKWICDIKYEARLVRGTKLIAKETVSGRSERLKVFGRKEAEQSLGEIFTDMINRLDLKTLLRKGL